MSDARLRTKIRHLVRHHLSDLGFELIRPREPTRRLQGLRQGLEFQPGNGFLAGQYTINITWAYTIACDDNVAFDACVRIGELAGHGDIWFSSETDKLEQDFASATALLFKHAIPYLQAYNSIDAIVAAYEAGALSQVHAFGPDAGWQAFHLGFCYSSLGRNALAIQHLRKVVEEHSHAIFSWVGGRRTLAENELRRLSSE